MSTLQRLKPALAATAIVFTLVSSTAFAEGEPVMRVIKAPFAVEQVNPDGTISLEGVVEYVDLEGGYFRVGEWSLMGSENFAEFQGKRVTLTGKKFDGISVRMVKSLVVSQISLVGEAKVPSPLEPVTADSLFAVEGVVEYTTDLEGGIFTIDGWGLIGDEALFTAMQGKRAIVRGKEFTGISVHQMKQIEVASLMLPLAGDRPLPTEITVNDRALPNGQRPAVIDGVLMLPLRHVVEAAGGKVHWDPQEQAVFVSLPDRHAYFWVGQNQAEMNENNVRYIRRNMIAMSKAPVILNGRTMISADALTSILGLYEVGDTNTSMDLAPIR